MQVEEPAGLSLLHSSTLLAGRSGVLHLVNTAGPGDFENQEELGRLYKTAA